ncbi:hypothetical protein AKJ09_08999 [Labilithrix luteola]|uniref:Uncharacterized protein n=1 Tax=Labilithrix luteola TaxID=1391654 RepID=A0A0K1Q967_9BACT|nr:hypothetical protein [Labilithrix luteola]AKV02336.1 hypothetical protein AKJ09_08999 [Labilithrix luteola]
MTVAPTADASNIHARELRTLIARGVAASEDQSPAAFAMGALLALSEDLHMLVEVFGDDDAVAVRLRTALHRLSERSAASYELAARFADAERGEPITNEVVEVCTLVVQTEEVPS